jgi:hypothetical protein
LLACGPGTVASIPIQPHEALHALAIDVMALTAQPIRHLSGAEEWRTQVLLIDQAHEHQILFTLPLGIAVEAGAGNAKKLTLPADTDIGGLRLDRYASMEPFSNKMNILAG